MPFRNLKLAPRYNEATELVSPGDDGSKQEIPKPPQCPNCKIGMTWYNSRLQRQNGSSRILHSFACQQCGMVIETTTPTRQALRIV